MATVDVTGQEPPPALGEPVRNASGRWITKWTLGSFGWLMPMYAAGQILLPKQASDIAGNDQETLLGIVTTVAAVVTIIVNIVVGALSDRTLARRGRRQIWVLGGAILTGVFLAGQGLQTTVLGMVLVWAVVQVGMSSMSAALAAAVPDEVPVTQRAFVSAFWGVSTSAGPLIGIALVSLVFTGVISGFGAMAVLCVVLALPFALTTRSTPLAREQRPPFSWRAFLAGIVAPLRHADFAWAWGGRFFIQLSNALQQVFLYFFLRDRVHVDPDTWTFYLVAIYTVAAVACAIPAGRYSDRTMRRKRLVVIASVLQGVSSLLFAIFPTITAGIAGALILGAGWGSYAAVDQALITQVLPNPENRGKDLGVINIANNLPYVLAGSLGGLVISGFGRDHLGYPVLFFLSLVTALLAALTVRPIRSVR
ncbi:MAG TPA: MFS transporter [Pseudonocardiaceae bacterium]|jgi:MFS family permease|nr:MFS transporter [Pseudonocardiaceae bacterium]